MVSSHEKPATGNLPFKVMAPDKVAKANGQIVGRLIDAATGRPVEGATVACGAVANDTGEGGGASAVTDATGTYRRPVEGRAEEAMALYVSLFQGTVTTVAKYGPGEPGLEGTFKRAEFTIAGHRLACIDSPTKRPFTFTPAAPISGDHSPVAAPPAAGSPSAA
jgi:hypothetical protein